MDVEKLIERLSEYSEPVIAYKLDADFAASITDAISELRCKCDGCSVPATTAEMIRDLNDAPKLRAENEKLRAERERKNEALDFARTKDAEIVRLGTELERVKLERDAAVEQLHGICSACKNYSPYHNRGRCRFCVYEPARNKDAEVNDNWQWRGPQKED